jgi:hypothetical protein
LTGFGNLALRCAQAASKNIYFEDFKLEARHSLTIGEDFQDQMRVLEKLILEEFIELRESRLCIGNLSETEWLRNGIADGSPDIWSFVECYPDRNWKFNPNDLSNRLLGSQGELFVIEELKRILASDIHSRIIHVSTYDDSAGFDIKAPSKFDGNPDAQLEVKTSSRSGYESRFFLTRNEYQTSIQSPNWHLVFVRKQNGVFTIEGHLPANYLANLVPLDATEQIEWSVAVCKIDVSDFMPGLP